jgi:hypothetical protein
MYTQTITSRELKRRRDRCHFAILFCRRAARCPPAWQDFSGEMQTICTDEIRLKICKDRRP